MTAAISELHPPPGGWTTEDLDQLPEDGHRYELIDGALIGSPSPTSHHQKVASRLEFALDFYRPTGRFTETIKIDEPWEIEIPISQITPRFYRAAPLEE